MAISYNLISCDDVLYPNLYNRRGALLNSAVGLSVEFDTYPDQVYTVEVNNQCYYPYDDLSIPDGTTISYSIYSIKINNVELVTNPLIASTNFEVFTNITGGASYPPAYPSDYINNNFKNTNYTPGTSYRTVLTETLQNYLNSSGFNHIYIKRATDSSPHAEGSVKAFSNFIIQKRESEKVEISFIKTTTSPSSTTIEDIQINFDQDTSTYQIDGVETAYGGHLSQNYVTTTDGLILYLFSFRSFEEEDCVCDMCENCYLLTNCSDDSIWVRTYSDLSDSLGMVVELEELEGCWKVSECISKIEVTIKDSYVHCKACQPKCQTPKCN